MLKRNSLSQVVTRLECHLIAILQILCIDVIQAELSINGIEYRLQHNRVQCNTMVSMMVNPYFSSPQPRFSVFVVIVFRYNIN